MAVLVGLPGHIALSRRNAITKLLIAISVNGPVSKSFRGQFSQFRLLELLGGICLEHVHANGNNKKSYTSSGNAKEPSA